MNINWFPGHMVKAQREIEKNIKLVDVAVMMLDARAPSACRNPELEKIAANKQALFVLNKADLAEPEATTKALAVFKSMGEAIAVAATDRRDRKKVLAKINELYQDTASKLIAKGRKVRPCRVMIMGVPNVGKSTLLNQLAGRNSAKTGAKPGVTRDMQWVRIHPQVDLLDTPGLMWPKIADAHQAILLAILHIIGDRAYEEYAVALHLLNILRVKRAEELQKRFKNTIQANAAPEELLAGLARTRGLLLPGGHPDLDTMAHTLLREVRRGEWGRLSFTGF